MTHIALLTPTQKNLVLDRAFPHELWSKVTPVRADQPRNVAVVWELASNDASRVSRPWCPWSPDIATLRWFLRVNAVNEVDHGQINSEG